LLGTAFLGSLFWDDKAVQVLHKSPKAEPTAAQLPTEAEGNEKWNKAFNFYYKLSQEYIS